MFLLFVKEELDDGESEELEQEQTLSHKDTDVNEWRVRIREVRDQKAIK